MQIGNFFTVKGYSQHSLQLPQLSSVKLCITDSSLGPKEEKVLLHEHLQNTGTRLCDRIQ